MNNLKEIYRIEEGYRYNDKDRLSIAYYEMGDGRVLQQYKILSSSFNRCPVCGNIDIGSCSWNCKEEGTYLTKDEFLNIVKEHEQVLY